MNDVLFSSNSELWETPQQFFDKLHDEFHFTLDPCALPHYHKCDYYFTPEIDGLAQDWGGHSVFCNPPYGRNSTYEWVKKAHEEAQKPNTTIVLLLPARTDTAWFHDFLYGRAEIRFIRGRLKFVLPNHPAQSAPFPSMIAIFRSEKEFPANLEAGKWSYIREGTK